MGSEINPEIICWQCLRSEAVVKVGGGTLWQLWRSQHIWAVSTNHNIYCISFNIEVCKYGLLFYERFIVCIQFTIEKRKANMFNDGYIETNCHCRSSNNIVFSGMHDWKVQSVRLRSNLRAILLRWLLRLGHHGRWSVCYKTTAESESVHWIWQRLLVWNWHSCYFVRVLKVLCKMISILLLCIHYHII